MDSEDPVGEFEQLVADLRENLRLSFDAHLARVTSALHRSFWGLLSVALGLAVIVIDRVTCPDGLKPGVFMELASTLFWLGVGWAGGALHRAYQSLRVARKVLDKIKAANTQAAQLASRWRDGV